MGALSFVILNTLPNQVRKMGLESTLLQINLGLVDSNTGISGSYILTVVEVVEI